MAVLDSGPAPSSRIESAVERELARRRLLLRLYLLLLLVPLGLAAWFLFSAGSEMRAQEELDGRLAEVQESYEEIAPKLEQVESLDEALPVVERAAEQLQAQEKRFESLQRQVRQIVPAVREIEANQAALMRNAEPSGELRELSSRLAAMERNLEGVQQLSARLSRQEEQLAAIQKQQRQVVIDLKEVEAKVERQPAGPAFHLQDLQKLQERVQLLEEGAGTLKKDLTRIRADVLERKPPG